MPTLFPTCLPSAVVCAGMQQQLGGGAYGASAVGSHRATAKYGGAEYGGGGAYGGGGERDSYGRSGRDGSSSTPQQQRYRPY